MPQIWDDVTGAITNVTMSNNQSNLRFKWAFVTFSGESQVEVVIRYRKANSYPNGTALSIRDRIRRDEAQWVNYAGIVVSRTEDMLGYVASGSTFGPPSGTPVKYNYTYHIDFPTNTLSEGFYVFQVGISKFTDNTGTVITVLPADMGWTTHRVEISDYDDQQVFTGTSTSATKTPAFQNEGLYGIKVEVMSEAGITAESTESTFNVWDTNKYYNDAGAIEAVPEHYNDGTQTVRVKRTS